VSTISRRAFVAGLAAAAALGPAAAGRAAASADLACSGGKAYWETAGPATDDLEPIGPAGSWRWTGPIVETAFREAVPSWEADTPAGSWIEVELRARADGEWGGWLKLGRWHAGAAAAPPASFGRQPEVAIDTLEPKQRAEALQARVTLVADESGERPTLRSLAVAFSDRLDRAGVTPSPGLARELIVPSRSQMVFPDGGRVWCSPTSVSMVMAYWAEKGGQPEWDVPVPTVVRGVWDHGPGIGGNWPFNAAFAAARGLHGKVVRLASLAEVEPWTAAGVPVVASIRFRAGELANAPILSALGGHLLVVRGFTADGDVLVNDPAAASDAGVARRYDRGQFERVWLGGSNGLVYLIYPPGWSVPELPRRCG
jgi:hypothetical protein